VSLEKDNVGNLFWAHVNNIALDGATGMSLGASAGDTQIVSSGQLRLYMNALAFFGHAANNQPTVTGLKGANAALASLLTGLASLGLIVDSSGT
jgi:hypothetical protein